MANQEHLDLLKQGVDHWNNWMKNDWLIQNEDLNPDCIGADLSGANLSGANLSGADFSYVNFTKCILDNVDFRKSDCWQASFQGAYLRGVDFTQASLRVVDLMYTDLTNAIFVEADMTNVELTYSILINANLERANLPYSFLDEANFSNATLRQANLRNAEMVHANLRRADLRDAILQEALLRGADLSEANLSGANLSRADLSRASLRDANLSNVSLQGADLRGADLRGATLRETDLTEAIVGFTIFEDLDLRLAKGLETVRHSAPSTIGIEMLIRSQGALPEIFLHEAGIPDVFLSPIRAMAENPLGAATCFLSYARADQAFVDLLFADLRTNGVRCWQAPEGLYFGEKYAEILSVGLPLGIVLEEEIDDPLWTYDVLLLVLSEQTLTSRWLPLEVKLALTYEQEQGKQLLLPILLDEASKRMPEIGTIDIWKERPVADFSRWRDSDAYQQAFTRLLHNLQERV